MHIDERILFRDCATGQEFEEMGVGVGLKKSAVLESADGFQPPDCIAVCIRSCTLPGRNAGNGSRAFKSRGIDWYQTGSVHILGENNENS
jgi:hypothetical protein